MENQTTYYAPVQPGVMVQPKPQIDMAARKKRARKFCFISLGFFAASILTNAAWILISNFASGIQMYYLGQALMSIGTVTFMAAEAFMIVARIKCRESVFGKVLMWVYIAAVAIVAIFFVVIFGILAYSIGTLMH
jgi:hypothetical protein